MEATLRTAAEIASGRPADRLEFTEVRAVTGLKEAQVLVGDRVLSVGVANGLAHAKILLEKVKTGEKHFDVIEVMACPGGCVGGGGQPYPPGVEHAMDHAVLSARARALYDIDAGRTRRRSHENPAVQEVYATFLGKPGCEKAHELLHTRYRARTPRGVR
jgi:iron only hydrogenase large subunit-like protein